MDVQRRRRLRPITPSFRNASDPGRTRAIRMGVRYTVFGGTTVPAGAAAPPCSDAGALWDEDPAQCSSPGAAGVSGAFWETGYCTCSCEAKVPATLRFASPFVARPAGTQYTTQLAPLMSIEPGRSPNLFTQGTAAAVVPWKNVRYDRGFGCAFP